MAARSILHWFALVVVVTTVGCGGGSDLAPPPAAAPPGALPTLPTQPPQLPPAPPSPAPAPSSSSPYYLVTSGGGPFTLSSVPIANGVTSTTGRHLIVVDPAAPAAPAAIEHAGRWLAIGQIDEGVVDRVNESISQLYPRFVVYLKQDGRLRRLDLRRGTWPPSATLLSTLQSSQICYGFGFSVSDLPSPQRSALSFTAPGLDNECGTFDDRTLMVRYDTSHERRPNLHCWLVRHRTPFFSRGYHRLCRSRWQSHTAA